MIELTLTAAIFTIYIAYIVIEKHKKEDENLFRDLEKAINKEIKIKKRKKEKK